MTAAAPAVRGAHVMRREDGKLAGGGTIRDPMTGKQLGFEQMVHHLTDLAVVWFLARP